MRDPHDQSPFPTPGELRAQLVLIEQDVRLLADVDGLARRLFCHNTDDRYSEMMDALYGVAAQLSQLAMERLRTIARSLTDDLPF